MPRSLAFCCERMSEHLGQIQHIYAAETEAGRMAAALCRERLAGPIQSSFDGRLDEYLRGFLAANDGLDQQVESGVGFVELTYYFPSIITPLLNLIEIYAFMSYSFAR